MLNCLKFFLKLPEGSHHFFFNGQADCKRLPPVSIFLLVKLPKTTTDGAASKNSNEIHLKLDNCQLHRTLVNTSGLLATWLEFWAISLSFLGI